MEVQEGNPYHMGLGGWGPPDQDPYHMDLGRGLDRDPYVKSGLITFGLGRWGPTDYGLCEVNAPQMFLFIVMSW